MVFNEIEIVMVIMLFYNTFFNYIIKWDFHIYDIAVDHKNMIHRLFSMYL